MIKINNLNRLLVINEDSRTLNFTGQLVNRKVGIDFFKVVDEATLVLGLKLQFDLIELSFFCIEAFNVELFQDLFLLGFSLSLFFVKIGGISN
jgi:hypothetical protein